MKRITLILIIVASYFAAHSQTDTIGLPCSSITFPDDDFYQTSVTAITGGYAIVSTDRLGAETERDTIFTNTGGGSIYALNDSTIAHINSAGDTSAVIINFAASAGGSGTTTTVTDLVNAIDIVLTGDDITVDLDFAEVANDVGALTDILLIEDVSDGNNPKNVTIQQVKDLVDDHLGDNDQTLAAARTVTMNANDLTFDGTVDVVIDESTGVAIGQATATSPIDILGVTAGATTVEINDGQNNISINPAPSAATAIGSSNVSIGLSAGAFTSAGDNNIALGTSVGQISSVGDNNLLLGFASLFNTPVYGNQNINVGYLSGANSVSMGDFNIGIGSTTFSGSTITVQNTAVGYRAAEGSTLTAANSFFGNAAGIGANASSFNTFVGNSAAQSSTMGESNSGLGTGVGINGNMGSYNTMLGQNSYGSGPVIGDNNTFLGADTNADVASLSNSTALGYHADITKSDQIVLGNEGLNGGTLTSSIKINGVPLYATTAAAAADATLESNEVFKVSNGDGTSTLHIKD